MVIVNVGNLCEKECLYSEFFNSVFSRIWTEKLGVRTLSRSDLFMYFEGMGRSITFHAENRGAPRIACADFMPVKGKDIIYIKVHLKGKENMKE